jgi:hypothetical protein
MARGYEDVDNRVVNGQLANVGGEFDNAGCYGKVMMLDLWCVYWGSRDCPSLPS